MIYDDWYKYKYKYIKKCYYLDLGIFFMFCFFLWFYCSCSFWIKCYFVCCYGFLWKKSEIIKYLEKEFIENVRGEKKYVRDIFYK